MASNQGTLGTWTLGARRLGITLLVAALIGMAGTWTVSAGVLDPNVVRFEANPDYINLGMKTSITVEVATAGDYRVTVFAPDATTVSLAYNFTAAGTQGKWYGNASADFMAAVDQVGTYEMRLEVWDGAAFNLSAFSSFRTTDVINIRFIPFAAGDNYIDRHTCLENSEIMRGNRLIPKMVTTYESTGAALWGNVTPKPIATFTMFGVTKNYTWASYYMWHSGFEILWDAPVGIFVVTSNIDDGLGNRGQFSSPASGSGNLHVVASNLRMAPTIADQTGTATTVFSEGDTLHLKVKVDYNPHVSLAIYFAGPLNATRGGAVKMSVGSGAYSSTTNAFANNLVVNQSLSIEDANRGNWSFDLPITSSTPLSSDYQAVFIATDGATPPNVGTVFSTKFAVVPGAPPAAPAITRPPDASTVNGTATIQGTAEAGVTKVQVKVGDGAWADATGTTAWTYTFDTKTLADGVYTVRVKAFSGTLSSSESSVSILVKNGAVVPVSTGLEMPLVAVLAIIALVVGLGIGMMLSRRKSGGQVETKETKEGDQGAG